MIREERTTVCSTADQSDNQSGGLKTDWRTRVVSYYVLLLADNCPIGMNEPQKEDNGLSFGRIERFIEKV